MNRHELEKLILEAFFADNSDLSISFGNWLDQHKIEPLEEDAADTFFENGTDIPPEHDSAVTIMSDHTQNCYILYDHGNSVWHKIPFDAVYQQ